MASADHFTAASQPIDAQERRERGQTEAPLPPEIAEDVAHVRDELAANCEALAVTLFRHAIGSVQARHKADVEKLKVERVALLERVVEADTSTHAAKSALAGVLADLESTREALTTARSTVALSEERARAAEGQREFEAREAGKQIATLQAQAEALGGSMQQAQRQVAFAAIEVRRLEEQLTTVMASAEAAQREAVSAVAEKRAAQSRADKAEWDGAALDGELKRLRDKVAQLTSALRMSHDLVAATRAEIAVTRPENVAVQHRADRAEHTVAPAPRDQSDSMRTVTADIIYLT